MRATPNLVLPFTGAKRIMNPEASHRPHPKPATVPIPHLPDINLGETLLRHQRWTEARCTNHSHDRRQIILTWQYPHRVLTQQANLVRLGHQTRRSTALCRHCYAMQTSTPLRSVRSGGNWRSSLV